MQTFAYVNGSVVREVVSVPDGLTPGKDIFTLAYARDLKPCGEDVREGWTWTGGSFVAPEPDDDPVPVSVSSAQAKIQLSRAKFLDAVKASVEAIGGEVEIWFTDARTWERANSHVMEIGAGLNLSPAEIDDLFRQAVKISA